MPTPTSTRWIDSLVQRVDHIRRAHNLCELQRTVYIFVAAALAGATLLLLTALFGSTRLFAAIAWSTVAAFAVTTLLLVRETRWLRRERAVAWIESRTALGGRLRSLIELHARGVRSGSHFFLPLLRAENERALPSWEPEHVVPRRVPRVALAVALVTTSTLLAALTLTPVLHPRVPELATPNAIAHPDAGTDASAGGGNTVDPDITERSRLAAIPADIQERIRQSVWGSAWDRAREAMLEKHRSRQRAAGRASRDESDQTDDSEGPWQLADRARPNPRPLNRSRSDADAEATPPQERPLRHALEQRNDASRRAGRSGAGAGAGSGTSPELYGAAAPPDLASHPRFELGLVTRMRLQHRLGQPGDGSPPRAPDQRPRLAISDRGDELAHEMAIPRAYEPIVRQVFAHRNAEGLE